MSIIHTEITAKIYLELTEAEAMALAAICAYGPDQFKKWFYEKNGEHYLKPWEHHLESLFKKATSLRGAIQQLQNTRGELKKITI
jgi:hypothetical protein